MAIKNHVGTAPSAVRSSKLDLYLRELCRVFDPAAQPRGAVPTWSLQLLYRDLLIRIDAHLARNLHRFFRDLARR